MTEQETAFVIAYPLRDLGKFRFEVFSAGGDATSTICRSDVCEAIPEGKSWGCDNFNRREFTLAAVRAAFPSVEALEFEDPPSTRLFGRLPDTVAVRQVLDRDTLDLRARVTAAEQEIERLTKARVVGGGT